MPISDTTSNNDVTEKSGTTSFNVSNVGLGTIPWIATVVSGGNWLTITSGSSGTNSGTINCSYTANPDVKSRTATVRITATTGGVTGSPKDVTVVQSASKANAVQVLAAWTDSVQAWDFTNDKWSKIATNFYPYMIAAGRIDTDEIDDLVCVCTMVVYPLHQGLYYRRSIDYQWVKLSSTFPTWIVVGDLNNDGRDDVIGTWAGDGTYYRDSATGKWIKLTTPAKQLAAGRIGGSRDDLAGVWSDGLWVRYSTNASWKKIDGYIPTWIAVGDINKSNKADIIGSYGSGTFYFDIDTGWLKVTTPAEQLAAGDINGGGIDDLVGVWSDGIWIKYGETGQWKNITGVKPKWIATGKVFAAVQSAGQPENLKDASIVDLSDVGPGGNAFEYTDDHIELAVKAE